MAEGSWPEFELSLYPADDVVFREECGHCGRQRRAQVGQRAVPSRHRSGWQGARVRAPCGVGRHREALLAELVVPAVERGADGGARVVWGRCHEEGVEAAVGGQLAVKVGVQGAPAREHQRRCPGESSQVTDDMDDGLSEDLLDGGGQVCPLVVLVLRDVVGGPGPAAEQQRCAAVR